MLSAHTGRNEKCRCLADYVGRVPRSALVDRVFPRPQNYRLLLSIPSFLVQRHAARKAQHYLGPVWMHFPHVPGIFERKRADQSTFDIPSLSGDAFDDKYAALC